MLPVAAAPTSIGPMMSCPPPVVRPILEFQRPRSTTGHQPPRIRPTLTTMKLYLSQIVSGVACAAALLFLASCASKPEDERNTSTAFTSGVPGGTWLESYKIPVTVTAIDPASRKVTLTASDNTQTTFTAGPDFKGFDQLKAGDQVQAAVAKEMVVYLRKFGPPPEADTTAAKALVPEGEHSGLLKADPVEKTATVTAINPNQGQATLKFADGTSRDITVRSDVNLWNFKVGEEVVLRARSAAVLNLEKP